jgi:hypothetical protein
MVPRLVAFFPTKFSLDEIVRCAALCNGAVVSKTANKWDATGEPTEVLCPNDISNLDCTTNLCCEIRLLQGHRCRLPRRRRNL